MKKILLVLPLIALLASCLELEQTITLKKDGSAMISLVYQVPEANLHSMQAAQQAITKWQGNSNDTNWFFDEKAVRSFYHRPQEGIQVLIYKTYRQKDKIVAEIVIQAKHAQKVFEQGYFGNIILTAHSLTFQMPSDLNQLPPQQIKELRTLCGDMSMSVEVITPKDLKSTNGFKRAKNRVFWKLSADGHGMDVFGKLHDFNVTW